MHKRKDMKPGFETISAFKVAVVVVVEGPGTLTLEPIYRDRAGSETAGPRSLITFPLALFPLVLPQHNFLYGHMQL